MVRKVIEFIWDIVLYVQYELNYCKIFFQKLSNQRFPIHPWTQKMKVQQKKSTEFPRVFLIISNASSVSLHCYFFILILFFFYILP